MKIKSSETYFLTRKVRFYHLLDIIKLSSEAESFLKRNTTLLYDPAIAERDLPEPSTQLFGGDNALFAASTTTPSGRRISTRKNDCNAQCRDSCCSQSRDSLAIHLLDVQQRKLLSRQSIQLAQQKARDVEEEVPRWAQIKIPSKTKFYALCLLSKLIQT